MALVLPFLGAKFSADLLHGSKTNDPGIWLASILAGAVFIGLLSKTWTSRLISIGIYSVVMLFATFYFGVTYSCAVYHACL